MSSALPDVAEARKTLIAEQPGMDTATLLFIDETAVATNLIGTHGRAPKGQRLVDKTPHASGRSSPALPHWTPLA